MKNIYLTLIMLFVVASVAMAQTDDSQNYKVGKQVNNWDLGIHLGLSNSGTDTHSWGRHGASFTQSANFAYGLNLKYHLSDAFALRLNYFGSMIEGDDTNLPDGPCSDPNDEDRPENNCHLRRGWSYESPIHELSLDAEWEPLAGRRYSSYDNDEIEEGLRMGKFARNSDGRIMRVDSDGELRAIESFKRIISPYGTVGLAFAFTDPDIDFNGDLGPNLSARRQMDIEDFNNWNFQIPYGIGLRFDLSEKIYADVEFRSVVPITDWIDGMYNVTFSESDLNNNDSYQFGTVRLGFRLGSDPDTDGDGIKDKEDSCPFVPGDRSLNGCPDSDGDGVTDRLDSCPDVAGMAKFNGCPDSDGDGIVDSADRCPNTKGLSQYYGCPDTDGDGIIDGDDDCPTEAGLAKYNGCQPADRDQDGVIDDEDACPDTPGTMKGCPDSDGDGVADNDDRCPNVKGSVLGCPDSDGDGIMDSADKCPNQKGVASNNGCPERKIVTTTTPSAADISRINFAMRNIKFVTDSDAITGISSSRIDEAVAFANSYPGVRFMVAGYTDSRGDAEYNRRLSERRAKKVHDEMVKRGVDPLRLTFNGFGEESPIADNATSEGRAQNRRVEILLVNN